MTTGLPSIGEEAATEAGTLVENIMHFGRTLRRAGLPIGPGQVIAAVEAVQTVGIRDRRDFYWTLHAVLVNRREQREIFDQAFHVFWRNPQILEKMMAMLLPQAIGNAEPEKTPMIRRLAEALKEGGRGQSPDPREEDQGESFDAAMTWSDREVLQAKDFEQMSLEEMHAAKAALQRLLLPLGEVRTRRWRPSAARARIDQRATLRASLRTGGDLMALRFRTHRMRPPPLVVLCDISGSMGRYTRLLLHFLHALALKRGRVHTFLFGTRLTNVTRPLRQRDVDKALDAVAGAVEDWAGGTRIGRCLHDFNLHWARRVLGQNPIVLMITDGLDRDAGEGLGEEMARLHRSCRRLIWLNPLLRYDGFEPKAQGMKAILPHVDEFRPAHNLKSLAELAQVLSDDGSRPLARRFERRAA